MNLIDFNRNDPAATPADDRDPSGLTPPLPESGLQRVSLLVQYLSIVRRRKWIILGAIAAALMVGLVITLLMTPQFTSTATLEIQRETRNFTMVEGVEGDSPATAAMDQEFYQTQYGLLRAKSLADRVATSMRLFDSAEFFEMFNSDEADQWFENGRLRVEASTRAERVREAGDLLLEHLSVTPQRMSRLVAISFTSPDPSLSKRVVDAWAAHFVQATLERRFEATSHARRFLEERLGQLRSRIDESERQLVDYAAQQGIVNLPATTPPAGEGAPVGERSLVADDLASINSELARASADRIAAQSRLGASGDATSEALQNDAISRLRERRAELSAEYARMMTQFEPEYPQAQALRTQIERLDSSLAREEARVRTAIRQTYSSSVEREDALRDRVSQLKTGVLDLRRRSIQYNIYQREVDTNRQLYEALLQRYKEIGVAGGVGVNNISVVDDAEVPQRPSSPNILFNMLLALIAGALVGAGGTLVMEQIDEAVADPSEVEDILKLPLLGSVPKVANVDPVVELQDRKSAIAEAYLSLQTSLNFSTDHGVPRTLAVTSTRPGEGKTTTSYALAQSLARAGHRTLLIDSDMRSPSIHHLLEMENAEGLSNYLAGTDDLARLVRPTQYENLSVMTAGPQPPSAAELLSGERLAHLMAELRADFDHVIFDAPPVMGLADAPLIASRAEGTVFVLESHGTKKSMARVAVGRLRAANAQITGAVLTKFDSKRAHYGYGYDYGYGYGETAKTQA